MPLSGKVSACRSLLAQCRNMVDNGQWQSLENSGNDYMAAFVGMKDEVMHAGLDDENMSAMQELEREQRLLIRLIRQRQQAIQEQLQVLGDARKRLNRVQEMTLTEA